MESGNYENLHETTAGIVRGRRHAPSGPSPLRMALTPRPSIRSIDFARYD